MKRVLFLSAFVLFLSTAHAELYDCTIGANGFSCQRANQPIQPKPQPAPQPQPTPQPAPQPQPVTCTRGGELRPAHTSSQHCGTVGTTSVYRLPSRSGALSLGDLPDTPTELTIEVSISRTPRDWDAAKGVSFVKNGVSYQPCYTTNGAAGGGITWGVGSFDRCPIQEGYINIRYILPGRTGEFPISYFWYSTT